MTTHVCGTSELPCYMCRVRICRETAEMRIFASRAYPLLTPSTDRETLARWLQTCDPNGCHTDELARNENIEPYDLDRAWRAVAEMIEVEVGR